jgi:putative ABC transport system permease protein
MAHSYWPDENPIGKRISNGRGDTWKTIVGVVGDVKQNILEAAVRPQMYVPLAQSTYREASLVVRAAGDPLGMAAALRKEIWAVDRDQAVDRIQTMDQIVAQTVSLRRFSMLLLGGFAALALLLAAIGIYGVVSYSVAQQTHDIGVRMALGAGAGDVLRMVLQSGLVLVLAGVAIGLAGALAVTRLLAGILYGVSARDPATFVEVSVLLAAVALVACYIPARRATTVDPITALRYE